MSMRFIKGAKRPKMYLMYGKTLLKRKVLILSPVKPGDRAQNERIVYFSSPANVHSLILTS